MIPMVHVYKKEKQWELLEAPIDRQDKIEWFESLKDFPSIKAPLLIGEKNQEVDIFLSQENVGWVKWDDIST